MCSCKVGMTVICPSDISARFSEQPLGPQLLSQILTFVITLLREGLQG